jgi:gamma-glutamylputrescine oxidase
LVQALNCPVSWYEATAERGPVLQSLDARIEADVCVVGAGLAGLTTALELATAGKSVVLLEAWRVACGASGRNGGFVSNGFALGVGDIVAHVGLAAAQELHALSRMGTDYVRQTILAHDPNIIADQGLRVCVRYDDRGGLHQHGRYLREHFDEEIAFSNVGGTRALLKTERYFDSIALPKAFHIHPLRYALLLLKLCQLKNVKVYEQSPALGVAKHNAGFRVTTAQGHIDVAHVVHCVSSLDRKLHPLSGQAVLPVATYVAVTEPLEQETILTREAISDTRRAGDYYRRIDGNRVLWGGRITTRLREPQKLAGVMRQDMISTFPKLGQPRIDYAWMGLMGYALHKMPLIGRDAEGQWFATAFGGHGLNTTAMAGQLVAKAISQGDDSFRRFSAFAPRWAFGQLGRLGVQGSYWLMQAKDKIDERFRRPVL